MNIPPTLLNMKNSKLFVLMFPILLILFSCGEKKQEAATEIQESTEMLNEKAEKLDEQREIQDGEVTELDEQREIPDDKTKASIENIDSQDFESMSCKEFATAYSKYIDGYVVLISKYKDIDKNDYQAALAANNDMMKLAQEQAAWMSASADFLQKCGEDEEFITKMNETQKKLNEAGN